MQGKVWKFKSNIDTDIIIAARYLNNSEPTKLAKHIMEDINPDFSSKVSKGDIIVAGENFGCGSSREHAPIALKHAGISAIIAPTFARIFYRNAFNMGLPIFEIKNISEIEEGDILDIDINSGEIRNITKSETYKYKKHPKFMEELISKGGLIEFAKEEIKSQKQRV